jgi:hypothetical protein
MLRKVPLLAHRVSKTGESKMMRRTTVAFGVLVAVTLPLAACGGGDGGADTPATTTVVSSDDTVVPVKNKPRKSQQITVTGGGRG